MLVKDYATLEAEIDKSDPSRLLIEIALRPASLAGPVPAYDPGEVQRAIRDGFREALTASRARAARQDDEAAEIEGEAMVRPGRRFHALRRARQRNDPSSVGVPYRASICRRIDGAIALRSGGAIDRSPEPGFAIDRRARDVERRAGRAATGPATFGLHEQ